LAYNIQYKRSVGKDLSRLDKREARRVLNKIEKELSTHPDRYPTLKGNFEGLSKMRMGECPDSPDREPEGSLQIRPSNQRLQRVPLRGSSDPHVRRRDESMKRAAVLMMLAISTGALAQTG